MAAKIVALVIGAGFGLVISWAGFADPRVIRDMLLLREPHGFLVMGSAIAISTIGVRLLRRVGARALVTGEPIAWRTEPPSVRHVAGSALFGAGWCIAGTCPGPAAAMVGQGRLGGLFVCAGLVAGVLLQRVLRPAQSSAVPNRREPDACV